MRVSLEKFRVHILKLLFPPIFCCYFRHLVSETNLFSGLKLHQILHTCLINAVSFYCLWHGAIYSRQYTDKTLTLRKSMYMRASGASLENCWHILHSKTAISFNICCWYIRYLVDTNDMLVGLTCTDKFPNVPTNSVKSLWGGGGREGATPWLR